MDSLEWKSFEYMLSIYDICHCFLSKRSFSKKIFLRKFFFVILSKFSLSKRIQFSITLLLCFILYATIHTLSALCLSIGFSCWGKKHGERIPLCTWNLFQRIINLLYIYIHNTMIFKIDPFKIRFHLNCTLPIYYHRSFQVRFLSGASQTNKLAIGAIVASDN